MDRYAAIPFLNASSSAVVTLMPSGVLLVPPLASRSGKPPRAPADATVWLDCFCSLDEVLNLPSRPPFYFGSSFFASLSLSPPASPALPSTAIAISPTGLASKWTFWV